ncbi:MAG: CPBP family intramembrane glutamic endopeptidase [Pseudomonadota bacterium]
MTDAFPTPSDDGTPAPGSRAPSRRRLWIELVALFVGVPVAMLASFGLYPLFPVLALLALVSAGLLAVTPGFRWRQLLEGGLLRHWRLIAVFTAIAVVSAGAAVLWLRPHALLAMPVQRPALWLTIMLLYPLVSALPQELIFRALFFHRYGTLFASRNALIAANAAAFGFGHLFYQNWVAITLSAGAGAFIAYAYGRTGSFPLAWALHALGGMVLFTLGLGVFFYHGAVPR